MPSIAKRGPPAKIYLDPEDTLVTEARYAIGVGGKMFLFCVSSAHDPCIQIIEKRGTVVVEPYISCTWIG